MSTKQNFFDRFPPDVPFHYRFYLWIRRFFRQSLTHWGEYRARKRGATVPPEDLERDWQGGDDGEISEPKSHINKCMHWIATDLSRPDIKAIADEMTAFKAQMSANGFMFCSPAGTFRKHTYNAEDETEKLWEDTWVLRYAPIQAGMRVLDIGGASTPFSFFTAGKGCKVVVLDNDWANCGTVYNANYVARKMGLDLRAVDWDIAKGLPFPDNSFDRVFSICVIEHLRSPTRRLMMREIGRVLKPGAMAGLTVDYDLRRKLLVTDRGLRFGYLKKFLEDAVTPSGLELAGNTDLVDVKSDPRFKGAFFLHKKA